MAESSATGSPADRGTIPGGRTPDRAGTADLIAPDDEHNRELVANVHPPDWANPEPKERYHLVVVGAGTAGLVTAAGAAGLGARVALVERHLMGGDCLNVGCVPSKGLIAAGRAWHAARHAGAYGGPAAGGDGDFAAVMERMRRLRAGISRHDSAERFSGLGVDVFLGEGRFLDDRTVEVDGSELHFRRAVIATGGRAAAPPIPGLDEVDYLTNETLFELTERPGRLGVIGGGPIGCEMSQAFARLGSEVTLLEMTDHVLPKEAPDAAAVVQGAMVRDGVDLLLEVEVRAVEQPAEGIAIRWDREGEAGETVVDRLLVAVGRAPNVEGLGLEAAGVEHDRHGIRVDDKLRTTNRRIYACGDVASAHKFTHTADAQARIVIQNALFVPMARSSDLVVPWCTYTTPEIAHVGIYESDARERGIEIDTVEVQLSEVDRAVLDGDDEGFLRVHLKGGSDEILGATLVAAHAGDILAELCLAMTAGIGLEKIAGTIHPYPTQAEVIKKAADRWRRTRLTPVVRKLLGLWLRVFG